MKYIFHAKLRFKKKYIYIYRGRIQDFKLGGGGGALKKIAPSGGRRENLGYFV